MTKKTFREYRAIKKEVPILDVGLGQHSEGDYDVDGFPILDVGCCTHSVDKENKDIENLEEAEFRPHGLDPSHPIADSREYNDVVHDTHAPMDDSSLTQEERNAIHDYTDHSAKLNSLLRAHSRGKNVQHSRFADLHATANNLDSVLDRHVTNKDFHVYTGIKESPSKYFSRGADTAEMSLPAFTSTSTQFHTAKNFSKGDMHFRDHNSGIIDDDEHKHVLKIHVPKGTNAVSVRKHTFVPEEQEVLLHRGHHVIVDNYPQRVGKGDDARYIWNARIVSHVVHPLSENRE